MSVIKRRLTNPISNAGPPMKNKSTPCSPTRPSTAQASLETTSTLPTKLKRRSTSMSSAYPSRPTIPLTNVEFHTYALHTAFITSFATTNLTCDQDFADFGPIDVPVVACHSESGANEGHFLELEVGAYQRHGYFAAAAVTEAMSAA